MAAVHAILQWRKRDERCTRLFIVLIVANFIEEGKKSDIELSSLFRL